MFRGKPEFKKGEKWRFFYYLGCGNNKIIHILTTVDKDYIVVKSWMNRKQRYYYSVEHRYFLELSFDNETLTKI